MIDLKLVSCKDGVFVVHQEFEVKGNRYYIINEGPYEVKKISAFGMRIRKVFGLKNPKNGVVYETTK